MILKKYKSLWLTAVLLCSTTMWAFASQVTVSESTTKYRGSSVDSWQSTVSSPSKELKKAWKDYMQQNYQADIDGIGFLVNKKILTMDEASANIVNNQSVRLFLKVEDRNGSSVVNLFGQYADQQSINFDSDQAAARALKQLLQKFLLSHLIDYQQQQLQDLQENFQDLSKERENMISTIENNNKDIEKMQKEILDLNEENRKLQTAIQENEQRLREAQDDIERNQQRMKKLKNQKN